MECNWTNIIQAIAALIAVPGVIISFWILVKRDKKRESEIASLSTIAQQLTNMQNESEKRYQNTKKPLIEIKIIHPKTKRVTIDFINSNEKATLLNFNIDNIPDGFSSFSTTTINQSGKNQTFTASFVYKNSPPDFFIIPVEYITEEGYKFFQEISFQLENSEYLQIPSAIINKHDIKS